MATRWFGAWALESSPEPVQIQIPPRPLPAGALLEGQARQHAPGDPNQRSPTPPMDEAVSFLQGAVVQDKVYAVCLAAAEPPEGGMAEMAGGVRDLTRALTFAVEQRLRLCPDVVARVRWANTLKRHVRRFWRLRQEQVQEQATREQQRAQVPAPVKGP